MIRLLANTYTAVKWTGTPQNIADTSWLPIIDRVYAQNATTGQGFISYYAGRPFPTLTAFLLGQNYLIYALSDYDLPDAVAAPDGAFDAFAGYTPTTAGSTSPTVNTGPGFIATATAAQAIIGGRPVARTANGLVPYMADTLDQLHLLFGIALNSALPGGTVSVQRGGYVNYPGLGLTTGATLFAGAAGGYVNNSAGMAFSQILGRAISADEFIYQPEAITILYPFSLSVV